VFGVVATAVAFLPAAVPPVPVSQVSIRISQVSTRSRLRFFKCN